MAVLAGRYEVIRTIGSGGMGEVLLARQLNLGRLVVIKRVLAEDSPVSVKALLDEARLAAQLSHPAIVSVLDVSAVPPYIAMEYVAGLTARELLASAGMPVDVALAIAVDVLRGLVYAHRAGVLHRDIKPRNIMVTFAGYAKLIDFGISRWVSSEGVWESTSLAGTPGYMAPELQPSARLDGRVDVFALGVTLRELLVGKEPAPLPAPIEAIVTRATAPNREDRYASCGDMLVAVEDAARKLDITLTQERVERYIAEHHADKVAAWQRESSNALRQSGNVLASEAPTRPLAAPISPISPIPRTPLSTQQASTVTKEGYAGTAAATNVATRPTAHRRSFFVGAGALPWWLALAIVMVISASIVVYMRRGVARPEVITIATTNAGSADDAWLGAAIEHVVARDLRDTPYRRFGIGSQTRATLPIEIAYQLTPQGVLLEAHKRGQTAVLARAEAASVVTASAALAPQLVADINSMSARVRPGPDEVAQMVSLGARDYAAFIRLRAVSERLRMSGYHDPTFAAGELRALLQDDPTWARLHAELSQTLIKRGESRAAIEEGLRKGDPARDPNGMKLLDGYKAIAEGRWADADRLAAPIFSANGADIVAGEIEWQALWGVDRDDESRAVLRRLHEKFPALYFGGDLVTAFEREVQGDRALELAHQIIDANPENISAMRELVRLQADSDQAAARRDAQRMVLVHGIDNPLAYADLFEALLAINDLATAHRVVDAMLLSTPLSRARGLYRSAVLAIYEGRFDLARSRLHEAINAFAEFGDLHSERPQCYALLRDIATFEADTTTRADALHGLAEAYVADAPAAAEYRYYEQAVRTGSCPDPAPFVAELDDSGRQYMKRRLTQIRAAVGCGTCAETVAAGVADGDTSNESLVTFAKCALAVGDVQLAKRVAQSATVWSSWASAMDASALQAILARYYLAEALARLGDTAGARTNYERFLRQWGDMPKPIAEVTAAKAALAKLPR